MTTDAARTTTRRREPHPESAARLAELRAIAEEIRQANDDLDDLYGRRADAIRRARRLNPPPSRVELAEALEVSDSMLSKLLRDVGAIREA